MIHIAERKPYILRSTQWGRRLFPIDQDELDRMLKAGTARKVKTGLYETRQAESQAPEDLDSVVDEQEDGRVYETKVMVAEKPAPRRRGRPRKVVPDVRD